MTTLHNYLIRTLSVYHNWHQTKHHNTIHWGVLVVFALIVFALILNSTNQINAQADITPPSIPANLTASAVSSSQINLSWIASTDNVGVTGYKIYRCAGSGCTPTTQIAASATNSYSNTGLTASTAYTYAVSAYDAAGNESGKSSLASVTTQAVLPPGSFNVPLIIQEALPSDPALPGQPLPGVDRVQEPVTVGIPLSEDSGISSIDQLGLFGVTMGQFRVLARWPNGNIKWVLIDTKADVFAQAQNTSISLTTGAGNFGGSDLAMDNGSSITINTGPAQFTVKKTNFNVFDTVVVNGQTLVNPGNNGRILMRDQNDLEYSSLNDSLSTTVVEENGPVRTVIKVDGSFKDTSDKRLMDYTLRMHFYRGKSYVKAYATLRNASKAYPSHVLFNSAELLVPLNLGSSKTVEFASKLDTVSSDLQTADTAYMFQGFSNDKLTYYHQSCGGGPYGWDPPVAGICQDSAYNYDISQSGLAIQADSVTLNTLGSPDDWTQGFARIQDSSQNGLTVAYRWMSAYWPAGFEFKGNGETSIELFSKRNAKKGLKFAFGAYETREILWNFHTTSQGANAAKYILEHALIARASLSHYQETGAIFGQSEFVTPEQQQQFFADAGKTAPSLGNPIFNHVFRYWPWPMGAGDNQTDFPLMDLVDFLRTGNGGFYLRGEQRTLYNSDNAVSHSDDFTLETNFTVSDPIPGQDAMNGNFFDMEHAHMMSLPFYYYLSGNEAIKESVLDYGEGLDRTQITGWYPLPSMPYFRAWSRKYRNFALIYEFSCAAGSCNLRYKDYLKTATDFLLNSRDDPQKGIASLRGRNLERGYIYWDSEAAQDPNYGYRVVHSFFHTEIHFEAMWQALRIMNETGWSYERKEELEDYLLGLSQFFFNEYYIENTPGPHDAWNKSEFGFAYDYPLDQSYTPNTDWRTSTISYQASRAAVWGYQKTGDLSFLNKASKLLRGYTEIASERYPSDLQAQALIHTYVKPPALIWKNLDVTIKNNTAGSYTLSWTVPQEGAGKYQIKYSDKPIVEWLGFDKVARTYQYDPAQYTAFFAALNVSDEPTPAPSGNTQSYTISGLDPNKQLYFAMKYTTIDSLPPQVDIEKPSVPTNLKATAMSSSQIDLSWNVSTDNAGVTGYRIYRDGIQVAVSTANSYSDTGLSASTTYSYAISAYDKAGNESAQSISTNSTTLVQTPSSIYDNIQDNTWVVVDQGTYADRDAGLDPPFGILAYSGMAIDTKHRKLLLFGGGHNDYSGNEVWAWDINQQTWQKMYEPDPLYNIDLGVCKASVDNVNLPGVWLPSEKPITRHTYDSVEFIGHAGVMIAGGSSTYSGTGEYLWNDTGNLDGCYFNGPKDTWIYNLETNQWTYKGSARTNSSKWWPVVAAYDSDTGFLIATGESGTIWLYDINTNTWTQKFPHGSLTVSGHSVMTYDSKRKVAYLYGGDYPPSNDLWAYSVTNNNWTLIQPQGTLPPPRGGYGVVYDSTNDVVIIFGNDGLWVYDPNLNIWEKNPGTPLLSPSNNMVVFGTFKYDPINNVSFLVHGTSGLTVDVWAYRYKKSSLVFDTISPSTPTNFQSQTISSSQINLSWTASTDNVGLAGYKIYRCVGLTCAPTVQIATSAANSYSDTGLAASTAYTYAVSAYDATGNESGKSSPVSAATLAGFKPSDLNQDTKVDQQDFDILKQDFNRTDKPVSDLNQDGIVDSRDLGIMMGEWGK